MVEELLEDTGADLCRWTEQATLVLIRMVEQNYEKFHTQLKKTVWTKIARDISATMKKNLTPNQCDTKWKGLKITYKKVQQNNVTSGKARKTWPFFEAMHSFMVNKPEINPPATCSNLSGLVISSQEGKENDAAENT